MTLAIMTLTFMVVRQSPPSPSLTERVITECVPRCIPDAYPMQ